MPCEAGKTSRVPVCSRPRCDWISQSAHSIAAAAKSAVFALGAVVGKFAENLSDLIHSEFSIGDASGDIRDARVSAIWRPYFRNHKPVRFGNGSFTMRAE